MSRVGIPILAGVGGLICHQVYSLTNGVKNNDRFATHTKEQQKKHPLSGMHEPLIPTESQVEVFEKYFKQYKLLIPSSGEDFLAKRTINAPITIKPLGALPKSVVGCFLVLGFA